MLYLPSAVVAGHPDHVDGPWAPLAGPSPAVGEPPAPLDGPSRPLAVLPDAGRHVARLLPVAGRPAGVRHASARRTAPAIRSVAVARDTNSASLALRGFSSTWSSLSVRFDTVGDLPQKLDGALDRNRTFAPQQTMQRFAFDVFHHEIKYAFRSFAEIRYADCVRMLDRSRRLRFAFESCLQL